MFANQELNNHLATSPTIKTQSAIIAEWNMNIPENIAKIGNYRYRRFANDKYASLPNSYDSRDQGNFYTNATDADVVLDGGVDKDDELIIFKTTKQKEKLLYSLEDCFGRFRPRSGINKARYGITNFIHHSNPQMASRPRYYLSSKDDKFKYWSSYRTEDGIEYGIANRPFQDTYYIDDAVPFVVYESPVPANRIIVKMQTNVGTITTGSSGTLSGSIDDPLYGFENQTTPSRWKIQYLLNNSWIDAQSFELNSVRANGQPIIGPDGYVELAYGLIIPENYKSIFIDNGTITSINLLPKESVDGNAFLLKQNSNDIGLYYIWDGSGYATFKPKYGWYLLDPSETNTVPFVTELGNPITYNNSTTNKPEFRELQYISGVRVVVEAMNKIGSVFDLIEISPRLVADLSDMTEAFEVTKSMSDLGVAGLPVGQLLAGVGSITLFDYDEAFNSNNINSLISRYLTQNLQIKFYEIISEVNGLTYYVPIKTMYAESFPSISSESRTVSIDLRDLFFRFESVIAPQILIPDVSLSYAISVLLDSIGFSNYIFKRLDSEKDPIIPYFYVGPEESVAQVLQKLAISTQTSMFFDEYNNFVCMSKGYSMPGNSERPTDMILSGSVDYQDSGVVQNATNKPYLSNIINIASQEKSVFNSGKISYTTKYIQKTQATIKQALLSDRFKTWVYKPAILWEVSANETTKSTNEQSDTAQDFALASIPLNSNISSAIPTVVNHQITNNVIDLGEGVYWLGRYNGYFYANAEIIKFDAVEYVVSGIATPVWITSTDDYQNYFSKISFNGKMYPTGRVRIYSEPNYETIGSITRISNGAVAKHGRGQFGTDIVTHTAGLDPYWKNNDNVRGCNMQSTHLFGTSSSATLSTNAAGVSGDKAKKSIRTDLIKNYLSSSYATELPQNAPSAITSQTVQSSALVFEGPSFETNDVPIDFISYIKKDINSSTKKYKHFGTRMRIIGKVQNNEGYSQSPSGAMTYYKLDSSDPSFSGLVSGGSGGISVLLNPETNIGYYYEIIALDAANVQQYESDNEQASVFNVVFYKIQSDSAGKAIPVKLWSGLSNIAVDTGNFTGQERVFGQSIQTVYDLAVEYENVGSSRKFYLYLNDTQIATITDEKPLPEYNSMALFVRGSSKCMFEHVYALNNNYSSNSGLSVGKVESIFANKDVSANDVFSKYAISGIVQSTYLSGISSLGGPEYQLYFDEFGTIMREAAYFNVKYDQAYPALYSRIAPTYNKLKNYTVSGYFGGSYGAEFLVFNASNKTLRFNAESGNYLRIQGIAFTQSSPTELTVDEYYSKNSDFSNTTIGLDGSVGSLIKNKNNYTDIKYSRNANGLKEFTLEASYIQSRDSANELMKWLVDRVMRPRLSVGVSLFATPTIQLGDLVEIDYNVNNIDQISSRNSQYIVYSIKYGKDASGPTMTIYLSEV